jgi:hypothetical protein
VGAQVAVAPEQSPDIRATILHVAWLSIGLGVGLEILVLAATALFSDSPGIKDALAGLARSVPWSVMVCVALAFGKAAAEKAQAKVMGIAGLVGAPVAFTVAKVIHQGTLAALGMEAAGGAIVLIGVLKSLEYGFLGAGLGWLTERRRVTLARYAGFGLAVGIVFGTAILLTTRASQNPTPDTAKLVARGLDELFFPLGCSLVLFATDMWNKRAAE